MVVPELDYEKISLEYLVFFTIYVSEQLVHESLHVVINTVLTGRVANCGSLGPYMIKQGRLAACVSPGDVTALNSLLTPVLLAEVGIGLMYWSGGFENRGLRWGIFGGGSVMWLSESLYSMGWLTPPTVTANGVHYWGDGVVALREYGWVAQLPGVILIAIGVVVIHMRYQNQRKGRGMGGETAEDSPS